jgi:hypothetical protein
MAKKSCLGERGGLGRSSAASATGRSSKSARASWTLRGAPPDPIVALWGGAVSYERGIPVGNPLIRRYPYRGTSLIRNCPPPQGHHSALGVGYCRVLGRCSFSRVSSSTLLAVTFHQSQVPLTERAVSQEGALGAPFPATYCRGSAS